MHSFVGGALPGAGYDGSSPNGIIQGGDGNFYGTTSAGGDSLNDNTSCQDGLGNSTPCCLDASNNNIGCGTIFMITPSGTYQVLYSFKGPSDGGFPNSLIQGSDKNFYSTAMPCNASSCSFSVPAPYGEIFQFVPSPSTSGTLNLLYSFTSVNSGAYPNALIEGAKNTFYGTTVLGGGTGGVNDGCVFFGCGVVFQLAVSGSSGTLSTVCLLASAIDPNPPMCPQTNVAKRGFKPQIVRSQPGRGFPTGGNPMSIYSSPNQLLMDKDGNLDGAIPPVTLTEQSCPGLANPNFSSADTIFQCTTSGSLTPINQYGSISVDGDSVNGDFGDGTLLALGSDGNLYGAEQNTIFSIPAPTSSTAPSPLPTPPPFYIFSGAAAGVSPSALIQGSVAGSDGNYHSNFYGTAEQGGSDTTDCVGGCGTVFELTVTPAADAPPPPVNLSFSSPQVAAGSPVTLSWSVLNGFSTTLQQCYAFVQGGKTGAGNWADLQTGSPSSNGYAGSVSLTPTQSDTYTYALTCGGVESGFATLTVTPPAPLTLAVPALPNGTAGTMYSATLAASGGVSPYTWSVASGTPAPGLMLAATGVISGIPTQAGTFSFAVQVQDSQATPASATANVTLAVGKGTTTTALTASASSANLGSSVTFVASVSTAASGTPTGSARFMSGSTVLGTASLTGGMASFSTTSLPASQDSVIAVYSGDTNFNGSTSAAVQVSVTAPNFALSDNPNSLTIAAGSSGTTAITFTPVGGFTGTVSLSCSSGVPQNATCTFSQPTLTATGNNTAATSTLTIATDVKSPAAGLQSAKSGTPGFGLLPMLGASSLAGITLIFGVRRRLYLAATLALCLTALVSGCGGGTSVPGTNSPPQSGPVTPAGTSMVVVTASAGNGGTSQALNLMVTITQ